MATMSYQGPLPMPHATFPRSQPFPSSPWPYFQVHAPSVLTGFGSNIFILDPVLPPGTTGVVYASQTLTIGGTVGTYTLSILSGSLPTGLSLNTSTGVISGTPSVAGTSSFTLKVLDSVGNVGTQAFSITVSAPSGGGGGSWTFAA